MAGAACGLGAQALTTGPPGKHKVLPAKTRRKRPKTAATAVFIEALDRKRPLARERRHLRNFGDEIVLRAPISIKDRAFAAFLVIQHEADGNSCSIKQRWSGRRR